MTVTNVSFAPPTGVQEYLDTDLQPDTAAPRQAKPTAGSISHVKADNSANAAEIEYIKLYDSVGAVVGTDAPDWIIKVAGAAIVDYVFSPAAAFSVGLQATAVTSAGTPGTTPPTASMLGRIVYS